MTPEEHCRITRAEQGLPPKITNEATLALIARATLDQLARADSASTNEERPPGGGRRAGGAPPAGSPQE